MTRGICENFYNYKVIEADNKPKYFKLVTEVMTEYNIGKNTVYNIMNNSRNKTKCKIGLNLTIDKIKLPVRKSVEISY